MTSIPPPPAIPNPVLQADPLPKFHTVRVNDARELKKFIADLREAAEKSNDSGGCYAAFLGLANGQRLQVEVGLPTTLTRRKS